MEVERRTRLYPTKSMEGLAKQDESSILRRWARLYPTTSDGGARLFSEEKRGLAKQDESSILRRWARLFSSPKVQALPKPKVQASPEAFSDWEEGSSGSDN